MDMQSGLTAPKSHLLPDTASYRGDVLHIADHSVSDLVKKFGTPLYIFDRTTIVNACASYFRAFQEFYQASAFEILYAAKAYLTKQFKEKRSKMHAIEDPVLNAR